MNPVGVNALIRQLTVFIPVSFNGRESRRQEALCFYAFNVFFKFQINSLLRETSLVV
jgi:hypothetical protein